MTAEKCTQCGWDANATVHQPPFGRIVTLNAMVYWAREVRRVHRSPLAGESGLRVLWRPKHRPTHKSKEVAAHPFIDADEPTAQPTSTPVDQNAQPDASTDSREDRWRVQAARHLAARWQRARHPRRTQTRRIPHSC